MLEFEWKMKFIVKNQNRKPKKKDAWKTQQNYNCFCTLWVFFLYWGISWKERKNQKFNRKKNRDFCKQKKNEINRKLRVLRPTLSPVDLGYAELTMHCKFSWPENNFFFEFLNPSCPNKCPPGQSKFLPKRLFFQKTLKGKAPQIHWINPLRKKKKPVPEKHKLHQGDRWKSRSQNPKFPF